MSDASVMKFEVESTQYKPRMLSFGVTHGEAQVETITAPAVAAATQGDFIIVYNQAGLSEALWLDIDAAGTAPTAAEYLACDAKTMVSVSTGDLAADVAAAIVAAATIADVTFLDNLDGTITVTQDIYGDCSNAVPYNEDASGAGSISVAIVTEGLTAALGFGKFDATLSQTAIGVFTLTFDQPFLRAPEVGATVKTDNRIVRVTSSAVGSVALEVQDLSGGAAADGNLSVIIIGSDSKDPI